MSDRPEDEDRTVYQPKARSSDKAALTGTPSAGPATVPEPGPDPDPTTPPAQAAAPVTPPATTEPPASVPPGEQSQVVVGEVLNGIYRITRFLARGGMGEVYEAVNVHPPSERVAVKVMLKHLAQDELVAAMFAKEAEMLTRLHHEAIVQYRLAARDAEGRPYIVTEFIDGPSLEEKLGEHQLSDEQFAMIAQKLAAGLGTAHALGAIHRDIAPDNILLANGDPTRPKIIDFGIAKDARENSGTIVGDGFAGKLRYVAPEQLGEYGRNVGPWSDIYSLALTLRAVAAGKQSDMGGSPADAVRKRMSVPDLTDIPPPFRHAFEMALQPDPAQRPQTMAEFIQLLDAKDGPAGAATFAPIADGNGDRTVFAPSQTKPSVGARAAGALAAIKGAIPSGVAQNKPLLIGGGAAIAVLLMVLVLVLVSVGGDETADGTPIAESGGTIGDEPTAPQAINASSSRFEQIAVSAVAGIDCSWLSFDGASGSTARFRGAAGNPAEAQSQLASALQAAGANVPALDFSSVLRIEPGSCAAVDALRTVRSEQPLISTPQTSYRAQMEPVQYRVGSQTLAGSPEVHAKAPVTVANVSADRHIAIMSYTNDGGLSKFTSTRPETEEYITAFLGDMTPSGFTVNYPAIAEHGSRRGLIVISSNDPLPGPIVNKDRFDETWAREFLQQAQANGWQTDAVWFTVEER